MLLNISMLGFLIVLYALIGVQGKAFPSRYKRNYEGSYHYLPYEEGIVQIPAGYSPENFPNYQDYINRYVQMNGHDWSAYYQTMVPEPIQRPYLDINGPQKMKAKHTWHFIDQNSVPVTQYTDGMHRFQSEVEAPNVIEALIKKEVLERHGKYDSPIVVEALVSKSRMDRTDAEVPVVSESLTIKGKPISKQAENTLVTAPSASYYMQKPTEDATFISSNEFELPVMVDSLGKKDKPDKVKPVSSYGAFELPIVTDSLGKKDKFIEVELADSYMKEKPMKKYMDGVNWFASDVEAPNVMEALVKKEVLDRHGEYDSPIVVEALVNKSMDQTDAEAPVVLESLTIKENQIISKYGGNTLMTAPSSYMHEPIDDAAFVSFGKFELPVVKDSLGMEKPIKEKPIKEKPDYSTNFDSLNNVELKFESVIEGSTRKEKPPYHEHESLIVVETLLQKHLPEYENKINMKKDKIRPKDLLHPKEESILTGEDNGNFSIPVVEALSFEHDTKNDQSPKLEDIAFDETISFKEPEIDGFDENGDLGSTMDFDRSNFARSFLPINSNIFSIVTNIQEQERRKFKDCVTLKNETGNCMPFQLCSVSSAVINIDELLRNVCIIDEVFIGVCCPEFPVETVRVDWEQLKPDAENPNEEKLSQNSKECGRLPMSVTDQDPWPWMASLIAKSSERVFCGGALIAEQYVLTAAHCTIRIPRNQILVRLGRPASENLPEPVFEVIEIKRHAGYNPRTMQNDIALLKLSRHVQLGNFRRVVCLTEDEESIGLVGESAKLLRWKETQGEIKDVESLAVTSTQDCQSRLRTAIADSILCTEPRTDQSMCNADSGAPLIIEKDEQFKVIGILTWNRNDCDERFPAVFTRVSTYHRWIEKLAS